MSHSEVVLISGGSKGLGAAIVSSLLAAGHKVATFSRNGTAFVDECTRMHTPSRFWWEAVDASDQEAVKRFVAGAVHRFGRIDGLINNAAIATDGVLALSRPADIDGTLEINLGGPLHLARTCSRLMIHQGGGTIINVSSIAGLSGYAGMATYSATKAGLDGMTRGLARELGPRGIRVNSVAPGFLETDLSSSLGAENRDRIVRRTPLRRLGTVEEIADAVMFLLSPAARFITGHVLVIDGGLTC